MLKLLSGVAAGLAIGLVSMSAQAANFKDLDPAQPSETPNKVEVLEFFSYSCIHCYRVDHMIEKWRKTIPEGAVFKRVPVGFNAGMKDLQKLYYALEATGHLDDLHEAAFKAIHDEGENIFTEKDIIKWVADHGVDKAEFTDVFNSFGVQTKVKRADELVKSYQIDATPTFAIGGRYLTSPATAGGYQQSVDESNRLMQELLN